MTRFMLINVQKLGFLLLDCDFHYYLVLIYPDCFSFTYLKKSSAKGHFCVYKRNK